MGSVEWGKKKTLAPGCGQLTPSLLGTSKKREEWGDKEEERGARNSLDMARAIYGSWVMATNFQGGIGNLVASPRKRSPTDVGGVSSKEKRSGRRENQSATSLLSPSWDTSGIPK